MSCDANENLLMGTPSVGPMNMAANIGNVLLDSTRTTPVPGSQFNQGAVALKGGRREPMEMKAFDLDHVVGPL